MLSPFNILTPYTRNDTLRIMNYVILAHRIGFHLVNLILLTILFFTYLHLNSLPNLTLETWASDVSSIALIIGAFIGFFMRKVITSVAFFALTRGALKKLTDYETTSTIASIKLRMKINKSDTVEQQIIDYVNAIGEREFFKIEHREIAKLLN